MSDNDEPDNKAGKRDKKRMGVPRIPNPHDSLFRLSVYLEIVPIRYRYEHCEDGQTTTEQHDWTDRNATLTKKGLEDVHYVVPY